MPDRDDTPDSSRWSRRIKRKGFNIKDMQIEGKVGENKKVQASDLKRVSSWGIIDGRPTIIDYGFTREVREKYYSFFKNRVIFY